MGLNDTPKGERIHIAIFGKRNAGKSSLINSVTGQELAIVSDVLGTTTDPVYKAMELLPLGPVMMIDTPGLDDEGDLGELRVKKAMMVLNKTDIAVIVIDVKEIAAVQEKLDFQFERKIISIIEAKKIPYLVVLNKTDTVENWESKEQEVIQVVKSELNGANCMAVSASANKNIRELKELLGRLVPEEEEKFQIVGDLLQPSDLVVLVVPIDKAAPKGRLILPQQQTIRDILESDAIAVVTKEYELRETLESLGRKPKLVITDSQVFAKVSADTPRDILLTSFSILFARHKGDLEEQVKGAMAVERLKDGDIVLMAEGCTHHRQCDDIGTVKIPRWLLQNTGKKLSFETSSGMDFPEDLSKYAMIVHCGGCTLNRREMQFRLKQAVDQEIPIVNYGVLIAYMQGILKRSLEPFPGIHFLLEE
ncbi:[FeFe] hydrogenase H-cluster maturation GTPase HydF [Anaeromicropila populeti]|uniref:Iron-only hydrogenase maturation protein HydF n=1 Tax=Anaeromicropila populeti TaxID=37658 RepID=A0A1I6KVW9_9FIRM|nr:[FeFe] hydrogenase H-cluster maturation GTPase HydF [Anaeromicropila populeti]SFR95389.1 iron-only hydrogenase maturation protein HydF [Anaeromicropila populeti]